MMHKHIHFPLTAAFILVFANILAPVVHAQEAPDYPTYIVQSGDTLSIIAARFGVSIQDLIDLNQIENPNILGAGVELKIPGYEGISGELILHTVNLGENYSTLIARNRFPPDLLARLNRMTSPEEIFAGSRLIMPKVNPEDQAALFTVMPPGGTLLGLAVRTGRNPWSLMLDSQSVDAYDLLPGDGLFSTTADELQEQILPGIASLVIDPLPLVQGKTLEIDVVTTTPVDIQGQLAGRSIAFHETGSNTYVSLQGIDARAETGVVSIDLVGRQGSEVVFMLQQRVLVESGYYGQDPAISVDPITIQPEVIGPEQDLVEEIVRHTETEKRWDGLFRYPVDEPCISAYFGGSRVYNNTLHYYHTGLDFNVCKASNINIYAVAPGTVVFAGPLIVRGNAVIIDHGWGVFTGYWHQSEIAVQVGQQLEAGQLIGYIGNTGRSTGSHLHLEVWVNGVQVDPLDWLQNEYPK